MAKKKDNYWILISIWMACIIMSTIIYVKMNATTHNTFLSVTATMAVAMIACICVWQIFTQLDNMVPKSERERIKAKKLADAITDAQTEVNVEAPKQTPEPQTISHTEHAQQVCDSDVMSQPTIEQPVIDISVNHNDYQSRNRSFLQKQADKRKTILDSVVEYVHITMAPYMQPTEIEKLSNEVMLWADSTTYESQPVKVQGRLSTNDVYHFIWNIAERLSTDRKYTGDDKAKFIKLLFPTICSDVEISSISRNLKVKPREGNIHIDEMTKDSINFHYAPTEE